MNLFLAKLNLMRVAALAGLTAAVLAACGGGDQIEKFEPSRIVVFGDESSLIEADPAFPDDGRKYTVNGVERSTTDGSLTSTRDCTRNPIWVQVLAGDYGYRFAECITTGVTPRAFNRAQANSTVAMMRTRIDSYITASGLGEGDLVTVLVGTHDVLAAATAPTEAEAVAQAQAAGTAVGAEVARIAARGAKVIVSTIPDVGLTPQGRVSAQASLLATLSKEFNSALRRRLQEVPSGGHAVGLVLGDEVALVMRRAPANYGINNVNDAACAAALPDCDETDASLVAGARTNHGYDWLWAGPLQLGPNAHLRLGQAAVFRARNNPF